nr:hypothetical protein CFP56_16737 [Quercus suber]
MIRRSPLGHDFGSRPHGGSLLGADFTAQRTATRPGLWGLDFSPLEGLQDVRDDSSSSGRFQAKSYVGAYFSIQSRSCQTPLTVAVKTHDVKVLESETKTRGICREREVSG